MFTRGIADLSCGSAAGFGSPLRFVMTDLCQREFVTYKFVDRDNTHLEATAEPPKTRAEAAADIVLSGTEAPNEH